MPATHLVLAFKIHLLPMLLKAVEHLPSAHVHSRALLLFRATQLEDRRRTHFAELGVESAAHAEPEQSTRRVTKVGK